MQKTQPEILMSYYEDSIRVLLTEFSPKKIDHRSSYCVLREIIRFFDNSIALVTAEINLSLVPIWNAVDEFYKLRSEANIVALYVTIHQSCYFL